MYQQYRKIKEDIYGLIEISGKFDEENDNIVMSSQDTESAMKQIFTDWKVGDVLLIQDTSVVYPILENGKIREMTREEKIIKLNMLELLSEGEKIQAGKIIAVEKPVDLYQPRWNNNLKCWQEGADRTQLIKDRTQKILAYKKLKDEIETLELFTEFEAPEGIADLKNQLAKLKQEIDDLLVIINKLR